MRTLFGFILIGLLLWYLVRRRSSNRANEGQSAQLPKIRGDGKFSVNVVGESFYRENFRKLSSPLRLNEPGETAEVFAELRLDDSNQHDLNAVAVLVSDLQVGHLPRAVAADFRQAIRRDGLSRYGRFLVAAEVCAPDEDEEHYSVRLDLPEK